MLNRVPNSPNDDTASASTGRTPTGTKRFWLLVRCGPLSVAEADGRPSVDDRRLYDIRQFNPLSYTDAVVYLGQYHDAADVLQRWLALNRESLADRSNGRALTYALSDEFEAAWHRIRDQQSLFRTDATTGGHQTQQSHVCPQCGGDDIKNLPRHLRSCNG